MNHAQIHIKGMHCRSCEILIEDELKKIPGVKHVDISHRTGVAHVHCDCDLDHKAILAAVKKAGYVLGADEKPKVFSQFRQDYLDLGLAVFIVTVLFFVAKALGIFNLNSSFSAGFSGLPVVFLVGLTAGVSTCMALVGGLVLGASARYAEQHPSASNFEKFLPHIQFNLGRIASYLFFGALIGIAGSVFQLSSSLLGLLTVSVGLVMLLLGGQLIGVFPILQKISFTLPKNLSRSLGLGETSHPAILGALTFFLPCGFTQSMQLYAMTTGSAVSGALIMGVFALGTAPGLLGIGGLASVIKGRIAELFFKTAGVVVILLAIFNVSNGSKLLGLTVPRVKSTPIQNSGVTLVNGVQEVVMTQSASGYYPSSFRIKKAVPVKWIINSTNSYTCATSLISPQLGIRKILSPGQNIFEFTPSATGTINFSCSMGMYSGSFTVVDNL